MTAADQHSETTRRTYGASRAVRLASHDYASANPLHVVICTAAQAPLLAGKVGSTVADAVEQTCELLGYDLYAYCLMPDHLHVLLSPASSETELSEWLRRFKSFTTRWYQKAYGRPKLWQRSAFDRVLRVSEPVVQVAAYIANNPVRKELVQRWTDWPYSKVFVA